MLKYGDCEEFSDAASDVAPVPQAKMSGLTSVTVDVPGDGQFHDYQLDLAKNRLWRGVITAFRFDPAVRTGVKFDVDYLRLH